MSAKWLARRLASQKKAGQDSRPYKLIVGLGNPGVQYRLNRHNVGFLVLERFASSHFLTFSRRRFNALIASGQIDHQAILLAKPQTYMNESGAPVAKLVSFHRIAYHDIIIVYDDLDLPLGKLRLKASGSAGGHHGMESIIAALGHDDFPRLRIGIGRPQSREDIGHVLGNFAADEQPEVDKAMARAVGALDVWISQGIQEAMNEFNA